jgi:hypothetical protein
MFQESLEVTQGKLVSFEQAVLVWFDLIYSPMVLEIRNSGALEHFPGRTEADLFIWIWQQQRQLLTQHASATDKTKLEADSSFVRRLWLKIHRRVSG